LMRRLGIEHVIIENTGLNHLKLGGRKEERSTFVQEHRS